MRDRPRVAVVIPCFNDGAYVTDAVASVAEQEHCELVVVNDGSADPYTLEVLAELERSGISVVHQENGGLSAARMAGLAATSAPYVQPLDADDRLPSGVLTRLADALDADPGANAAWGDLRTFGASDCLIPQRAQIDPWRITYINELPGTTLMRRDAILEAGGWEMGSGYEDWDLWMKCAERGWRGVHVSRITLFYREHANSRMYVESLNRHGDLRARLRCRRAVLFRSRRRHWRRSRSSWPIKVLFPAIEMIPRLPERDKERLWVLVRHIFEPAMSPDCFPSAPGLVGLYLRRRIARLIRRGS